MWPGETVFCLASGPTLTRGTCDKIRGRKTIAVNLSCLLAPWADILYFTDAAWYEQWKDLAASWSGIVVTLSRRAKLDLDSLAFRERGPVRVHRIKARGDPSLPPSRKDGRPGFPPPGSPEIQLGRSSGHTAISLAIALGASRVVMLGYDMRVVNGREHFHPEYGEPRYPDIYARAFVPCFDGWNQAALASHVEVLNATAGSAVLEFPFVDLEQFLRASNRAR
jgi:hypothetical protein